MSGASERMGRVQMPCYRPARTIRILSLSCALRSVGAGTSGRLTDT